MVKSKSLADNRYYVEKGATGFTQIFPSHVQAGWPGIGTIPAAWQPVRVFHDNGSPFKARPDSGHKGQ